MSLTARLRPVAVLTTANLWASASSLILFAIASHSLTTLELGRLSIFLAGSQLVVITADLGLTNWLIREVAASDSLSPLRWAVGQRLLIAGSLSIPVALLLPGSAEISELLAFSTANVGSAVYAAILAAEQALRRIRRAILLQLGNGAVFVSLAYGANLVPSTASFLFAIAASYALLIGICWSTLIGMREAPAQPIPWRRAAPFMASAFATAVTTTADTLIVGRQGPSVAAEYALAQRPALAFSSLNAAVTGILLPHAVGQEVKPMSYLRLVVAYPAVMLASAVLGWLFAPVLDAIFSGPPIRPLLVALIFGAYGGGVVSTIVSSWLVAVGREKRICLALWVQTGATLASIALLMGLGAVGVAGGVVLGRLAGFVALITIASEGLIRKVRVT